MGRRTWSSEKLLLTYTLACSCPPPSPKKDPPLTPGCHHTGYLAVPRARVPFASAQEEMVAFLSV